MKTVIFVTLFMAGSTCVGPAQNLSKPEPAHRPPDAYNFVVEHADVPMYPVLAKMARLQGTVRVTGMISHGGVIRTKVISGASGVLREAADRNLKTWKFAAEDSGELTVTYEYVLEKEEQFPPRNSSVEMEFPSFVKVTAVPATPTTTY